MTTKLGKIHILSKNNKTLCGKIFSNTSSSSYVSITNTSATNNYIKGIKYPRRCQICLNILRK